MDAETRDLLRGSIRDLFGAGDGDIVAGLEELGWSDVVADDPAAAVELLFTEQGVLGRSSSVLDTVVGARNAQGAQCAVVHPVGDRVSAHIVDGSIVIDGVLLAEVTAPVVVGTRQGVYAVNIGESTDAVSAVAGFDPASRLRRVRLTVDPAAGEPVSVDWADIVSAAERALASELVGNGHAMLDLAVDQISGRHQFGRPIGANQSPRHRLAESYALVQGAAELTRLAWRTGRAADARTAKAYAGYAVESAARACLQVCGAIGLTAEHALPSYVQRGRLLDAMYGGWDISTHDLGQQLISAGSVPTGAPL